MNKKLRALIDRAERLIAEREEVAESIRDLRKEVKSGGWDAAQIMKLAQLSHDDKKRAKLAATNEVLALYNRESGLGLDLGLDDVTPSPAGGENSSDASPPQAASQSSREVPAGEPIETDRPGNDDGAPEGTAAKGGESLPPAPDPDAGWQARDGHDSYILALQVGNGHTPHPTKPDTAKTVAVIARCDAGDIPRFLDRRPRA